VTELQPTSTLLDGSDFDRDQSEPVYYYGLSMETWIKVGILGALFMAVYWLVLRWLWDKTNPIYGEANWGHAICIPVVGLYYLYIHREELLKTPVRPNWAGLGMVLLGIAMLVYGIYPGQNQFFQGVAMVVALFGIVVGIALPLSCIGFGILAIGGALRSRDPALGFLRRWPKKDPAVPAV